MEDRRYEPGTPARVKKSLNIKSEIFLGGVGYNFSYNHFLNVMKIEYITVK